jgi:hypothetical protein
MNWYRKMNDNWFIAQRNETYINDISNIVDNESFINFLRIAYETNPTKMILGGILIIVVSIYMGKKTSSFVKKQVTKNIAKRM